MGYTLLPTQTRIPIPRPPLPVDRFPSFIVITSPSVIVTTLSRFQNQGAIHALWGRDNAVPEKELIFSRNDYFHNDTIYAELERVAAHALNEATIQENFVELMGMLLYAAYSPQSSFNRAAALEVLAIDRFREMLWKAATCRRIHRRSIGSLLVERKKFVTASGKSDALPIPSWVQEFKPDLLEQLDGPRN